MRNTVLALGTFLDVLHDAVLVVDRYSHIVFANKAVIDVFGQESGELVGKNLALLLPDRVRSDHSSKVASYVDIGQATLMSDRPLLFARHKARHEVAVSIALSTLEVDAVRYAVAVIRNATRLQDHLGEAIAQAETDTLTGLGNRLYLARRLREMLAPSAQPFSLLFVDLHRFKPINDELGHQAGDEVLRTIGQRIKATVREADIAARMGGDEFVVVLAGFGEEGLLQRRAHIIAQQIAQPVQLGALVCQVGVNIGGAIYPRHGRSAAQLIEKADQAMYRAKQSGRTYRLFDAG